MGVTHLSQRTLQGDDRLKFSVQYDLFGTSENFAVGINSAGNPDLDTGEVFHIHRENQVIKLKYPAYWKVTESGNISVIQDIAHSLAITVVDPDTQETETYRQDRPGSFFTETVIPDTSDEAQAEVDEVLQGLLTCGGSTSAHDGTPWDVNNFNPEVVTRLKVNTWNLPGLGKRHIVIVHYQACAVDQIAENGLDGNGPRYSPSLMQNLLDRVKALEGSNRYTNKFGTAHSPQDILEEDLSGSGAENYVQYEKHDIAVEAGINVIQPIKGAFYGHDVEIIVPEYERITLTPANVTLLKGKLDSGQKILLSYSDTESVLDATSHVSTMTNLVLTTAWLDEYLAKINNGDYSRYYSGQYTVVGGANTNVVRLEEGVDFVIESIDIPRTARVENADYVVYRHIRILNSERTIGYAGEVLVSYHAFGGEPSVDVIRSMHQDIENTRDILRESSLITTSSLPQQQAIISLNKRLTRMEEYHAHHNQVEHRVSIGHVGWHWFSIATIYNGNWELPTSGIRDIGHFRIQSILRDWVYEFMVDLDMTREDADKIHLTIVGCNQETGYDIVNFKQILLRDHVAIRLCWLVDNNGNPDLNSGVVLQMGWNFNCYANTDFKVDTDTIIVTNKSGSASSWILLQDPHQINYQAKGLVDVYNHRNLIRATSSNITGNISDHVFYKFQDKYVYVKTSDFYIKDGKKYFTFGYDAATGRDTYLDIALRDTAAFPEYAVGAPTNNLELFERRLWGRFPVQYVERNVSFAMIASSVTVIPANSEYYIYDDATGTYVALDTAGGPFTVSTQTVRGNSRRGLVISTIGNAPSSSVWNTGKFRTVFKATISEQYYPSRGMEAIATGEFYLVSDASYNEDTMFKMPNSAEYWSAAAYNTSKQCVRILEPADGLAGWIGNMSLAQFAPNYATTCSACNAHDYNNPASLSKSGLNSSGRLVLNGYTTPFGLECTLQKFIQTKYIKRMTAVVYDRRNNRYLVLEGPVSVSDGDPNSTIERQPEEAFCDFVLDTEDLCTMTISVRKYKLTKQNEAGSIVAMDTLDKSNKYGRMVMRNPTLNYLDADAQFNVQTVHCNTLYSNNNGPNDTTEIFFATIHTNMGTNSLLMNRFDLRQIRIKL